MKTAVQKWGNSLAIRIPRAFAGEMHLGNGAEVNLHLKSGKLVVSSIAPRRQDLRSLLARVRKSNLHSESDWGGPAGNEVW
jgi:antitoxin MazE